MKFHFAKKIQDKWKGAGRSDLTGSLAGMIASFAALLCLFVWGISRNAAGDTAVSMTTVEAGVEVTGEAAADTIYEGTEDTESSETSSSTSTGTAAEADPDLPPAGADAEADWRLILVNKWNTIPEDYEVTTMTIEYGHEVDERIAEDLTQMLSDCREEGHSPLICSSFRSTQKQQRLFDADVRKFLNQGYSQEEAEILTAESVAIPATSEHEIGMAVDIVYSGYQQLDDEQANNDTQQWLMANCQNYGFILRYPEDKTEITGITYEPWHYRYVGREAAQYIMENGICLEEYLGRTEHDGE